MNSNSQIFYALDVETANWDPGSICSIGIATFKGIELIDKYHQLIDPQDDFDQFNIDIHGISSEDVEGMPSWGELFPDLKNKLSGSLVVHHGHFDRTAMNRANVYHGFDEWDTPKFLNSTRVVRRTWSQFSRKGYGLDNVSQFLGISFQHHNALEDAITAGRVVIEASRIKECEVHDWLSLVNKSIQRSTRTRDKLAFDVNNEGHLFGQEIVFTGALSISRAEAAETAAQVGCRVGSGVTKKTTIVVVGIQDKDRLGGYGKSTKQRKAEKYIEQGLPIKVISEPEFLDLINEENDI